MTNTETSQIKKNTHNKSGLDTWDSKKFEHWLRVGVESFVLEGAGAEAFPGAEHMLLRSNSLPQGLRSFCEKLNATRLDAFKQGLAQVLSTLEPKQKYVAVAEQLLLIAVSTSAYPVLEILQGKIGNGFFGQQNDEETNSLFATTLYTVTRLATAGNKDAKRCLKGLISSKNFLSAYAGTALLGLCQVDSKNLIEHLNTFGLRSKLQEQFDCYGKDGAIQKQLAQQILEAIGEEELILALPYLDALDANRNIFNCTDEWLVESLLCSSDDTADNLKNHLKNSKALQEDAKLLPQIPVEIAHESCSVFSPDLQNVYVDDESISDVASMVKELSNEMLLPHNLEKSEGNCHGF